MTDTLRNRLEKKRRNVLTIELRFDDALEFHHVKLPYDTLAIRLVLNGREYCILSNPPWLVTDLRDSERKT